MGDDATPVAPSRPLATAAWVGRDVDGSCRRHGGRPLEGAVTTAEPTVLLRSP